MIAVAQQAEPPRFDHRLIAGLIEPGASVLDLGCGNGDLLALLADEKQVRAVGIEIDEQAIYQCVAKNLSVFHGDIETGLSEYGDAMFDYVILNESLQQVKRPGDVLREALRVGKKVVVGFPNFAHYQCRLQVFFGGRTPVTGALPYRWYDTPNLHFMSISDFFSYCRQERITIESATFISGDKRVQVLPNLLALVAVFLIHR